MTIITPPEESRPVNSAPTTPARSLSFTLSNLPASAAATNPQQWHCTATYHRQTNSAAMPAITILIVPIHLRSTDQMIVPIRLRLTDRLIDKLYAWPLSLPPLVLYYYLNRLLLLPPTAKLTPCCLPTAPQAQRKNCQCWNIWTEVMWSFVSLISHPYNDSLAPYLGTAILMILCFLYLLDKNKSIS